MAHEELDKRVYMWDFKKDLNLRHVIGDNQSLNRWVIAPDVNRPGLELTGYISNSDLRRVNILGDKEIEYMNSLSYETQKLRYDTITDGLTPCIIVSGKYDVPDALFEIASFKNFPVFKYEGETYQISVDVVNYLSERLAVEANLYGVMMNIYGIGVLLEGHSGIGKSELALELVQRGHLLVADDRVDAKHVHNSIVCSAPDILKRMLEIRGVGIVDVNLMYGGNSYLEKSNLDLAINLVEFEKMGEFDRLNPESDHIEVLNVKIPQITIPVNAGKPLSPIVEAAVTNFMLKRDGTDMTDLFNKRTEELIMRNAHKLNGGNN